MSTNTSKPLHIILWLLQLILGAMFIMAGTMKTFTPIAELSQQMPWTAEIPLAMVRFIGITQLLAGIGLILPSLLRILPVLTPAAAIGLAFTMLSALIFHAVRAEYEAIATNLVIMAVTLFVAWGRLVKVPIRAKR